MLNGESIDGLSHQVATMHSLLLMYYLPGAFTFTFGTFTFDFIRLYFLNHLSVRATHL